MNMNWGVPALTILVCQHFRSKSLVAANELLSFLACVHVYAFSTSIGMCANIIVHMCSGFCTSIEMCANIVVHMLQVVSADGSALRLWSHAAGRHRRIATLQGHPGRHVVYIVSCE